MKDTDLLGAAAENADQDILVMEVITTRLDAVKLRTRAKMMRMTSHMEADVLALEEAAEVLEQMASTMDRFLAQTPEPLAELRDRLAVVRRRGIGLVVDEVAAPQCLAYPGQPAGVGGCNCTACSGRHG